MALSYNLGYQESISVHPTRRQNFAGKPYSNFPNIWEWLIYTLHNITEYLRGNIATFFSLLLTWSYVSLRLSSALPLVGKASTLISVRGVAWSLSQPDMPYLVCPGSGTHVLHHFNWHSNNLVVVNFKFPFLLLSFQHRFYWMSQVWAIERPR